MYTYPWGLNHSSNQTAYKTESRNIYFLFTLVFKRKKPTKKTHQQFTQVKLHQTNCNKSTNINAISIYTIILRSLVLNKEALICKDRSAVESILYRPQKKRLQHYLFTVVILNNLALLFSFTRTRTLCSLND